MTRVKRGVTSRKKHKKVLVQSKGYYGARRNIFRSAKQAVIKSYQYSYINRKQKKRNMRRLWILKINAAVRKYNISYSFFIFKLKQVGLIINRKILSDMIVNDYNSFEFLIKKYF